MEKGGGGVRSAIVQRFSITEPHPVYSGEQNTADIIDDFEDT